MVGKEGTKWQGPKELTKVTTGSSKLQIQVKTKSVLRILNTLKDQRCESLLLNFEGLDTNKYS